MLKPKIFFPGLNGLRFFAALAVILTHIELLKGQLGYANCWRHPVIFNLGSLGVYFFFVLSGFLITYLLFVEKEATNNIAVKDFYIRRILRIWPLYYLITVAAFLILPSISFLHIPYPQAHLYDGYNLKLFLFIIILPNLAFAMYSAVPHAGHLWSIGVEEQFYLFWPYVINYFKNTLKAILLIICIIILLKIVVLVLIKLHPNNHLLTVLKSFIAMSKLESMSIGAIGAWILYAKKSYWLKVIYSKATQLAAFGFIPLLIYFTPDKLQDGAHIAYSLLFLVIIMNVATNGKSILRLNGSLFEFLGKISYGLYMYHMVVVVFVIKIIAIFFPPSGFTFNLFIYMGSVGLTVLLAASSYHFFEKWFIHLKGRYSKVVSGNEAKKNRITVQEVIKM